MSIRKWRWNSTCLIFSPLFSTESMSSARLSFEILLYFFFRELFSISASSSARVCSISSEISGVSTGFGLGFGFGGSVGGSIAENVRVKSWHQKGILLESSETFAIGGHSITNECIELIKFIWFCKVNQDKTANPLIHLVS